MAINTTYSLAVSAEQLRIIQRALEDFFRTRYCQFSDLANDLAFENFNWPKKETERIDEKEFNERINRRNWAQDIFDEGGRIAKPIETRGEKSHDCMVAEDIWAVIRYELYKERYGDVEDPRDVCARAPLLISGELPVKMKKIETED